MSLCSFTWQATDNGRAQKKLEKKASNTIMHFFESLEKKPELRMNVMNIGPGGRPELPLALSPKADDDMRPGVKMKIWTEGTQCLHGYMTGVDMSDTTLQNLIERGPYSIPPIELAGEGAATVDNKKAEDSEATMLDFLASAASELEVYQPVPQENLPLETPLQYLVRNSVPTKDIERLKATMSRIVDLGCPKGELPNTIQVPVEQVTQAIMEHMGLSPNESGTYRGVIGGFYSTRIAAFGLKMEGLRLNDDARYTDWVFDVDLIVDFVGGEDHLARLAQERSIEVSRRDAARQEEEITLPPSKMPEPDEQIEDFELLALAEKLKKQREKWRREQDLLNSNLAELRTQEALLLAQLQAVRQEISKSADELDEVTLRLEDSRLTDEMRMRLEEALNRITSVLGD